MMVKIGGEEKKENYFTKSKFWWNRGKIREVGWERDGMLFPHFFSCTA